MLKIWKRFTRGRAIAVWLFACAAIVLGSLMAGATATPSTWVLLFFISLTPPVVSFIVFRGAPPPTVAEVLHTVREQGNRP